MKKDVQYFNKLDDPEDIKNYITNGEAFQWLSNNIPLLDVPDSSIQQMYYFRWWSFRKHLVKTPVGYVFTEFIIPVKFAGIYNTISSALGHQIYEGRWLHDKQYIEQYIKFWLFHDKDQKKPHFHSFSTWIDNGVYNLYLVNKDQEFLKGVIPALDSDYTKWEQEHQLPDGLYWQYDVRDAMEESISGSRTEKNRRPTINSYMYGNARALQLMAGITANRILQNKYESKQERLKDLIRKELWDDSAKFYEVKHANGQFANAREELGYIPWYFNLPPDNENTAQAWNQLLDTTGFKAPWGITTAERRHPLFRTHGSGHGCEWDGAVWPYATTQTLKGLSNLLNNYRQTAKMNKEVFYDGLLQYTHAQQKDGHPFIGEYQDEKTGAWLRNNPRSRFYNHSGYADLIISDLIGLRPRADNILEINPLLPVNKWKWFCLDKISYHGYNLTILWDQDGDKYQKGKGFRIYENGHLIAHKSKLEKIQVRLLK